MPKDIHKEYPQDRNDWKSKPSYQVPEGYFDQLEKRLIDRIPEKKQKPSNVKRILLYATTIAAILVIGFGLTQWMERESNTINYTLTEDEFEVFLEDYSYDIDETTLYQLLDEEEIESLENQLYDEIETNINFIPTEEELIELL